MKSTVEMVKEIMDYAVNAGYEIVGSGPRNGPLDKAISDSSDLWNCIRYRRDVRVIFKDRNGKPVEILIDLDGNTNIVISVEPVDEELEKIVSLASDPNT